MSKMTPKAFISQYNKMSSNAYYVPGPVLGTRARKHSGQCMCEVFGKRRGGRGLPNSAVRREEVGIEVWEGKPGKRDSLGKGLHVGSDRHVGTITARWVQVQ